METGAADIRPASLSACAASRDAAGVVAFDSSGNNSNNRKKKTIWRRSRQRPWVAAAAASYCLLAALVGMSGSSETPMGVVAASQQQQHPVAAMARDLFHPLARERRLARKAAAEQVLIPETDITNSRVRVWVVTTACLPWMTGTSINPLLRAAFLARGRDADMVTLMVPFLSLEDQPKVFPRGVTFDTPEEQEVWVRNWLEDAGLARESERLRLVFYPGRYHKDYGSIFPMGDLTLMIPPEEADICILEEPEHLNWYRAPGRSWRRTFKHVVGVVHTNYLAYSSGYSVWGPVLTFMLRYMNIIMARAYCHKIIKLSGVIQSLAPEKETVCNVHGVRQKFLDVGQEYAHKPRTGGAYFIGKSLWAKGYDRLINLLEYNNKRLGRAFHMDVYGSGPDREAIEAKSCEKGCDITFFPATDHSELGDYSVFINPSVSEVLCTTVAEALAMGKWVVCARHSSNEFFFQFPNCLPFDSEEDFAACVSWALRHDPEDLTPALRHKLSWAAATERLADAAVMNVGERKRQKPVADGFFTVAHAAAGSGPTGDLFRLVAGADSAAWQNKWVNEQRRLEKEAERSQQAGHERQVSATDGVEDSGSSSSSSIDMVANAAAVASA
ncbi:unnamed protein product [Ectocarpus sp. 6 AP-2014]